MEKHYVCSDCFLPIANGDFTDLDYHYSTGEAKKRRREIIASMKELSANGYLTPGDDTIEFSCAICDCCGSRLAGKRHQVLSITG